VDDLPANLTPQYYEAEENFKKATTVEEKIAAIEEMLAVIPKHKGTEKMQAELKRRLSKLREEGIKKAKLVRVDPFHVEKQGAGQVVLLGFPNAGKSALVAALTRARERLLVTGATRELGRLVDNWIDLGQAAPAAGPPPSHNNLSGGNTSGLNRRGFLRGGKTCGIR